MYAKIESTRRRRRRGRAGLNPYEDVTRNYFVRVGYVYMRAEAAECLYKCEWTRQWNYIFGAWLVRADPYRGIPRNCRHCKRRFWSRMHMETGRTRMKKVRSQRSFIIFFTWKGMFPWNVAAVPNTHISGLRWVCEFERCLYVQLTCTASFFTCHSKLTPERGRQICINWQLLGKVVKALSQYRIRSRKFWPDHHCHRLGLCKLGGIMGASRLADSELLDCRKT